MNTPTSQPITLKCPLSAKHQATATTNIRHATPIHQLHTRPQHLFPLAECKHRTAVDRATVRIPIHTQPSSTMNSTNSNSLETDPPTQTHILTQPDIASTLPKTNSSTSPAWPTPATAQPAHPHRPTQTLATTQLIAPAVRCPKHHSERFDGID